MNSEKAENAVNRRDRKSRRKKLSSLKRECRRRIPELDALQAHHGPEILDRIAASYIAHREALIRIGHWLGLTDPEDAVQEAYLSLLKAAELTPEAFEYIWRRHHSRACTQLRGQMSRHRRTAELTEEIVDFGGDDVLYDERRELRKGQERQGLRDLITGYLRKLGSVDCDLLVQHYLNGLSIAKLSEITGFGIPKIKARMRRAREKACAFMLDSKQELLAHFADN